MKDVGVNFAFSNAKLVKFYFLIYSQHGDIDFNKKEVEERWYLISIIVVNFAYIRGKSDSIYSVLKSLKY